MPRIFFGRLSEPLALRHIEFNGNVPSDPCRFLVVEDFGTSGLEGDIELFSDPPADDATQQFFYWFWRNIGRSGKTGDDLGRWGLGKTVYRAASRVGSMFGLTVRESDRRKLLMGQAVLQIHRYQAKEFKPEGYWCGSQAENGLPLPIEDEAELRSFCEQWKLTRDSEPGLSIVCPLIPDDLKAKRMLQVVAVHFFTRILRGELEVEILGPQLGSVVLDRAEIAAVCERIEWDGPKRTKCNVSPPIEFAKRCLADPPKIETKLLGETRVPSLDDESIVHESLDELRKDFAAGARIGLRVKIGLPRRSGSLEIGELDVFVQRTEDGKRCESYYVREGMTITKINASAGKRGVQSLVLVDAGPLAEFLGDSEGPAHEDWDQSAERPDRIWQRGWKGRVKFVRRIVDSFVELLTPPSTEPDFDLLSDFFSIDRTTGQQRQRSVGDETDDRVTLEPIESAPKWFNINSRVGGFTVNLNNAVPVPVNAVLRVAVAYDLPKGNPLNKWSELDFKIGRGEGALQPQGGGAHGVYVSGNTVLLSEIRDNFCFSLSGFDEYRDLYIRVDEVTGSEELSDD